MITPAASRLDSDGWVIFFISLCECGELVRFELCVFSTGVSALHLHPALTTEKVTTGYMEVPETLKVGIPGPEFPNDRGANASGRRLGGPPDCRIRYFEGTSM